MGCVVWCELSRRRGTKKEVTLTGQAVSQFLVLGIVIISLSLLGLRPSPSTTDCFLAPVGVGFRFRFERREVVFEFFGALEVLFHFGPDQVFQFRVLFICGRAFVISSSAGGVRAVRGIWGSTRTFVGHVEVIERVPDDKEHARVSSGVASPDGGAD